jgi:hypothetical protein
LLFCYTQGVGQLTLRAAPGDACLNEQRGQIGQRSALQDPDVITAQSVVLVDLGPEVICRARTAQIWS